MRNQFFTTRALPICADGLLDLLIRPRHAKCVCQMATTIKGQYAAEVKVNVDQGNVKISDTFYI